MVNKKAVIIAAIITTIIVAGIVAIKLFEETKDEIEDNSKNSNYLNSQNINNTNNINKNTIAKNEIDNSNINNTITNESNLNNSTKNVIENSNTNNNPEKSGKDIAVDLAQKEWSDKGTDQNVYYYLEEQLSDEVYVISIRSRESTAVLINYEVNVKTGKISEY